MILLALALSALVPKSNRRAKSNASDSLVEFSVCMPASPSLAKVLGCTNERGSSPQKAHSATAKTDRRQHRMLCARLHHGRLESAPKICGGGCGSIGQVGTRSSLPSLAHASWLSGTDST